ncbi:adenylate cyclase type 10 isoform X2 [Onychomys torridus]|uniref:adenylate cyclase type 10 isoform X2 n=1 Tax=Onychomys torridus TaxID=38674 RepID=UPI00167F9B0B|nr:adenylate cyclase type 10 isoform X2 [Onychomys torridus]
MNARRAELQDRAIVKIAAHLPDLIVYGDFSPERPSVKCFDGVLMFVDISGFTAMTEKFSTAMYMDRGAEQLVEILNHYISAIVEKVLIFGGDILKFAGDALLALWKVERKQLKNIITVVIKCSLEIHGLFEAKEVEEGLDIRVKIGLAAGHITMLVFGDDTRNYFLVTGQAVDDVRLAQNMAQMNDVILSPNCWQLCDRNMIEIERIPDQRAVKVSFLKPPPTFNFDEFFNKCMAFMDYYPSGDHKNFLRLACMLESDPDLELSLQKYVMEIILKQIDDKQLRGYLSELRPVTIVFVNLMFKEQDKAEVIGSAIQAACVHITSVLKVSRGQINKVFMFDKGCSFLCVFGFPGEKVPDEITHALESAVDIFDFCSQVHKIRTVSIGVASGIVFCGIVGHTVRHEYTVIGQKVNIAARMMMYYPGIVTCDSVTYDGSNLPAYFFKELPKKVMKGVADAGPVYQCLGLNEKVMFGMACLICNRSEGYPLLGRVREIDYFMSAMEDFLMRSCSRVLMYEGLPGYGKSQILMKIKCLASEPENHRAIAIALTKISFHQNFYTIQILMANVLGLDTCKHYKERQTSLQNKVKMLLDDKFHCLLNDIFHVQFPVSREMSKMSPLRKQKHLEALFMKILEKTVREERIIFIIDEAQFVDGTSWAFIEKLIRSVPIFIIMSLSPFPDTPCAAASAIMKNRNTTYITLGVMQPQEIRDKVCVDLSVSSIPRELDLYLVEGSCGIPFYCEELLKNLDHHKVLLFQQLETEEKTNVTWSNLFKNSVRPTEDMEPYTCISEGRKEVCYLVGGVRLKNLSPPASLKEISLVQLDSMSLSHQMLVRCAAIIGLTFTTELLFEILPCWNMKTMIKALATLVKSNVFDCFRSSKDLQLALKQNVTTFEVHYRSMSLKSNEGLGDEEELREMEGEVIECHMLRFCRPIMQKTAYELWLKDQKKVLHLKCARFLEESAHQCNHCGNGDFIPYHHFVVDIRLNTLDIGTVTKMAKSQRYKLDEEEVSFSKSELPKKYKFPENRSDAEIRNIILHFFDNVIAKMESSQDDIIPLESCQCEELLQIVILPLAQHLVALEENNKALYYFLEVASAYLILGDNYKAYMYLDEGERLLKTLTNENSWSQIFEYATFYSLKGQVCFNMGQMVLAKKMLKKALKFLNRMFPSDLITLIFQMHVEKNRLSHLMALHPQEGSLPGKKLAELYLQASCFSLLWQIYSLNLFFHYKYYGQLAAMMQMNASLETQNNFQIIKAFLDYSLYHHLTGYQGVWFKYETLAMEQLLNLPVKSEAIKIMAYAADTLGHIKLLMGHLDLAIELGSRAYKMWSLLQTPNKYHMVLCRLSKSLFLKSRYKNLVQVLELLWDFSVTEEHIFSKAFFYFVCLDIMLYSGFIYRTFEECLEFVQNNEDNRILKFKSGLLLGLYSCIAVWYARLQQWDDFYRFSNKAKTFVTRRTPTVLYYEGISRYMEGQVLHLQKQIEERNAQNSGVKLLKALESLVAEDTIGPVFYPRLYHLMAYVCILMGDGHSCDFFLNTALELSETQGNLLEKCWLSMSKEWWYSASEFMGDHWLQTVLSLPTWDKIASGNVALQDVQRNKFLMRVNILDNPF